jgi:branched-chain amino acid transport system ATP-binding protein
MVALLDVAGLSAGYHKITVLRDVSFHVAPGEFVSIIGHNGAGKTTLVNAILGVVPPRQGRVQFDGHQLAGRSPAENVAQGLALVPQARAVFPNLTVADNLELVGTRKALQAGYADRLGEVLDLFPILKERARQLAGTMSGGQQRMLAIGIALMQSPRLLMLDEPSLGLAPNLVQQVMERVGEINRRRGVAILLIEQNVRAALSASTRTYVMKLGRMVYDGPPGPLHDRTELLKYF